MQNLKKGLGCWCIVWKVVRGSRWENWGSERRKEEKPMSGLFSWFLYMQHASAWLYRNFWEMYKMFFCIIHPKYGDWNICLLASIIPHKLKIVRRALTLPPTLPFFGLQPLEGWGSLKLQRTSSEAGNHRACWRWGALAYSESPSYSCGWSQRWPRDHMTWDTKSMCLSDPMDLREY